MSFHEDLDDLGKLRFPMTKLYGRCSESAQLLYALKRITNKRRPKPPEMVIISGQSGTGKTALANQLRQPVEMKGGYFISGKFDISHCIEPYTALVAAFTELSDILANDKSVLFRLKVAIQSAVGTQGKALTDVIPSLRRIINHKEELADVCPLKAGCRFKYVLRNFVRAICSPSHPLVLFLDDLQWADPASLEVLQTLLSDKENSSFLVVGSYHSIEVGSGHRLLTMLDSVEEQKVQTTKIQVGSLSVPAVNDMLADLLSQPRQATESLATIVHYKTQGNTFYIVQFLMTLCDEGLLRYNLGLMRWQWNSDKIMSVNITQNVIDLLMAKMNDLSPEVGKTMQVAACLGSSFELPVLETVMENLDEVSGENESGRKCDDHEDKCFNENLRNTLNSAIKEGLIERTVGKMEYTFVHDRIRSAIFTMIPENERSCFQYRIGRILSQRMTTKELEKNIFVVVDLLNHGDTVITDINERLHVSSLNLKACQRALDTLAFAPCIEYAKTGITLLDTQPWENHYTSSLTLHTIAAAALYCSGNIEEALEFANLVISNAKSFDHKYHSCTIQLDALASEAKYAEAICQGLHLLEETGVTFPRFVTRLSVTVPFMKTKKLLEGHTISDLSLLPAMEDKKMIKSMRLLQSITFCTYHCPSKQHLHLLLTYKAVQLSVHFGLCKYSPAAFALYGIILCMKGDLKGGYEMGQLSLQMLERLGIDEVCGHVYHLVYGCIMCWTRPAPLSMKPLIHGYHQGMACGDFRSAMMCMHFYTEFAFYSGYSLSLLESDLETICQQVKEYNQKMALRYELLLFQMVLNLKGKSNNPNVLTGSALNKDEMLKKFQQENNAAMIAAVYFKQMILHYFFNDYENAGKMVKKTKNFEDIVKTGPWVFLHTFFEGLTAIALAQQGCVERVGLAGKAVKKLKRWAKNGNVNCVHMISLLEAELLSFVGIICEAESKYKSAISQARKCGFTHDAALANERLGIFSIREEDFHEASRHLSEAYRLWIEWGAEAKADQLHRTYPRLVSISKRKSGSDGGRRHTRLMSASELIVAGQAAK